MATYRQRGRPHVYAWPGRTVTSKIDLSDEVVSVSTQKRLGAPSGSWQLELLPRASEGQPSVTAVDRRMVLYRSLQPNTLVSLGIGKPGGIMLGLVDGVRRQIVRSGQRVSAGLVVYGRDLGKALEVDNVVQASLGVPELASFIAKIAAAWGSDHPLIKALPGVWGPTTREGVPTFLGQSVADVVDWILANAPTMRLPVLAAATGGKGIPADYLDTSYSITTWNDGRIWADAAGSYQGNVWGFIWSVLDPDFYEVFVETIPNDSALPNAVLVVRPKPFDESAWEWAPVAESTGLTWRDLRTLVNDLEHHEVTGDQILQEALGYSDADAVSYVQVQADHELIGNPDGLREGLAYPLVDTYMGGRFGLRALNTRLTLVAGDVAAKAAGEIDYDGDVAEAVREFRNRAFNWYRPAPFFETGTLVVVGNDDYRVGDPVFLPEVLPPLGDERGVRYYCVGVDQAWREGQAHTSTLTLTRGHNDGMMQALSLDIAFDAPLTNLSHYAET